MKKMIAVLVLVGLMFSTASARMTDDTMKRCASCHAPTFDKKVFGKSKKLVEMSEKEIVTALIGYKDHTRKSSFAGIMRGQVARYSEKDFVKMAKIIKSK